MVSTDGQGELEDRVRDAAERALGAPVARVEPLAAQLGLRRFFRVAIETGPVRSLVARVDLPEDPSSRPAGVAPEPALEPIRALLERHGLPVPACYGRDEAGGIDLLEDVGDRTLRDAANAASADERRALYHAVCDLLPRIQRIADPGPEVEAFRRRLDDALFDYKARLFATWALKSDRPSARDCVAAAFAIVASAAEDAPQRLAHRDFQSANIHLRPGPSPGGSPVLIDLQGAFLAPPEYDLVCLLRDSYVDLDDVEIEAQAKRVRSALPDAPNRDDFARRFDLLTIARKGKDLARFIQAASERGDDRFLTYVPRTLRMVRDAAERSAQRDPRLADFAELCHEDSRATCAQ
jgi:aminoglycoside/choline kinase family phosphotransferase